jgi:hypothetical protein
LFQRTDVLIAVALTYTLGALTHYPPESGVLSLLLGLSFTFGVMWLSGRPRVEVPAITILREEIKSARGEIDQLKGQVERLILRGRS